MKMKFSKKESGKWTRRLDILQLFVDRNTFFWHNERAKKFVSYVCFLECQAVEGNADTEENRGVGSKMDKKREYEEPETEVIRYSEADVIMEESGTLGQSESDDEDEGT